MIWKLLDLLHVPPGPVNAVLNWMDRRYYANCGTIWWRFWFEVTGQGRRARRYRRKMRRGRESLADYFDGLKDLPKGPVRQRRAP